MPDGSGDRLLAAVEALMAEVRAMRDEARARYAAEDALKRLRKAAADRKKKQRGKDVTGPSRDTSRDSHATAQVLVVLDPKQRDQDQKPAASRDGHATDHTQLVDYGVKAIERAIGRKYPFQRRDGKHVKDLISLYGLFEAKRAVDLTVLRYQREEFWRRKGLTFGIVVASAQPLLTSGGAPKEVDRRPKWQRAGCPSAEAYAQAEEAAADERGRQVEEDLRRAKGTSNAHA